MAIVATDAGATPLGMATAPRRTKVASRVRTSQEGEAMTLLLCVCQMAPQEGIFWVVPDSESAEQATCPPTLHRTTSTGSRPRGLCP